MHAENSQEMSSLGKYNRIDKKRFLEALKTFSITSAILSGLGALRLPNWATVFVMEAGEKFTFLGIPPESQARMNKNLWQQNTVYANRKRYCE